MHNIGTITLQQGIGKKSGNPYVALKLQAGKWSTLHFPTQFEQSYLVEFLKENKGSFTIDEDKKVLVLRAGDYVDDYTVQSQFEYKYLVDYFRLQKEEVKSSATNQSLIDLSVEDEIQENPFN